MLIGSSMLERCKRTWWASAGSGRQVWQTTSEVWHWHLFTQHQESMPMKESACAALQQGVRAAELVATPPEPEAAHEERVAALQTSLALSKEQVAALEQEGRRVRCTSLALASQTSLS